MEKETITKDKKIKENQKETTALQVIPAEQRKDWVSLAFVQAGICVCVPAFLLGAMLAEAMPIWSAIISGSLGYLVVVIGMVITGMMGCDLGVPSCTACEAGFGKKGARFIVSIIFAVNLIGWFGIQNGVCGEAFTNGLQAMTGIHVPVVVSNTVWGLIMLLTAVYGMSALEKLDKISIPLLMIIMLFGLYLAFKIYGRQGLETETVQTMSFMSGVALSFNFTAVGTINAADYTRFQKSRKDTVKSVFYGVFPMGVITLIMGILLTKISGEYDISMVLINVGLPLFGIAAMIISTWTTNSTNAYSGGLNIVMAFKLKDNKRREATLIAGILGIVLCNIGVLSHIEGVLSLLSYVVCPIGGVIIADYWIVGKGKKENFRPVDGVNWCGVISWFIGALCAYFLVKVEFSGIIIGGIVYLILEKFMPSTSRDGICEQKKKKGCSNMRELKKQDMIDILYGCAVLGTGGGGPLEEGLAMMQKHFDNDEVLQLISLDELPDDEYVVTPYGCGAPSATGLNPKFKDLEVSEVVPSVLAMEALEEALGKKIYAVGSTELGGANTAEALHAALEKGVPLLDADPAGRSVPELQHSTYYVKGVPIYPMGVATRFGEKIVIQNVQNDLRAEDIVRAIAVASDNMVGVADHANVGKVIKESLIPDMITYAQEIGQVLREAKEKGADVAQAIADAKDGKILFKGAVTDFPWETRDGFNFGEIHLAGEGEYAGEQYKIWLKNENIISYRNGEVDVVAPDLICMIGEDGNPLTSPNFGIGQKMTVLALPSPEIWTTPEGLACFGPKHFGLDVEYKPFKK